MASTTLNHAERRIVQSSEMPQYSAAALAAAAAALTATAVAVAVAVAAEDMVADGSRLIVSELAA